MKRLFYSISILSALFLSSCSTDEVTNRTTTPPTGTIDVYTAGTYIDDQYVHYAIYNKNNGTNIYLTGGIEANGIYVEGNDVYVAGIGRDSNDNNAAVYWKNGVEIPVTGFTPSSIKVNGNDVYMVGNSYGITPNAVVWENGVVATLPQSYFANDIALLNNTTYITGKSDNFVDENLASWTNNVVALGENRTEGKAVFVVQN